MVGLLRVLKCVELVDWTKEKESVGFVGLYKNIGLVGQAKDKESLGVADALKDFDWHMNDGISIRCDVNVMVIIKTM